MVDTKPAPNWGRSWPQKQVGTSDSELVRLSLPESHDLTIALGFAADIRNYYVQSIYTLSVGNGGLSQDIELRSSRLGRVLHVVAQDVVVRVRQVASLPLVNLRLGGSAGYGRPTEHQIVSFNNAGVLNGTTDYPLLPWVYAVKVEAAATNGGGVVQPMPAGVIVQQTLTDPSGTSVVAPSRPIASYATMQSLNPEANGLRITNPDAVIIATPIITQYLRY